MQFNYPGILAQQAMERVLLMELADASNDLRQKKSKPGNAQLMMPKSFFEAVQGSQIAVILISAQDVRDKETSLIV